MKSSSRFLLNLLCAVALIASAFPFVQPIATVQAAPPTNLFFSEYIEGTSNNKALEIYNGTGAAVNLATGGYNVQMFFNGSATAGLTINLTGTVADGDVFVLAHSSASATILAQADQTNGAGWFNGDDAVVLRKGTTILDVIGQIGYDPGTEWGTGLTSTADNTLRRKATICGGDPNGSDAFDPSVEWDGYATDTFGGLGAHIANCTSDPKINEFVFNHVATDTNEYVEVYGDPNTDYSAYAVLQLEGDGTGAGAVDSIHTVATTNANGFWVTPFLSDKFENGTVTLLLVEGFTGAVNNDLDTNNDGILDLTPWTRIVDDVAVFDGGTADRTYSGTVLASGFDGVALVPGGASRIPDGYDTDTATDWVRNDFDLAGIPGYVGTIGPGEAYNTPGAPNAIYVPPPEQCGDAYTPIYNIQGDGLTSPLVGTEVALEGIVVGDFQNNASPDSGDLNGFNVQDPTGDSKAATSDGIFIYAPGGMDVSVGDRVRVRGSVSEYYGMTEVTASKIWICSSGHSVAPTSVSLPMATLDAFEPYEGMLVTFPQALYISEYFNFDRYGEIVLSDARQFQPTAIYPPGPDAVNLAQANLLGRITLDDGRTVQNPDPAIHPNGSAFTLDNLFRGGDMVTSVTGVMHYDFGLYRVHPTQGATYTAANPRPVAPDEVGGSLKVASFNVLNYFTTLGSRGANDAEEFTRQRDKIFAALKAVDADVVGLIEIENNGTAVADLVEGLNTLLGAPTYAYVNTGVVGLDEITVALIYKPATVSPVGDFAVLDDPSFTNPVGYLNPDGTLAQLSRPALAQSFLDNATGGVFTVVVNHLKSKGTPCGPGDDDPVQGNCKLTRTLGAEALRDWLLTDPTGSGDPDVLIIGDLNSYDKEDPIDVLLAGGYTDLIYQHLGEYAYSYLFDGQLGYLDHALANPALLDQVTGTTIWHINADEPDLIDYDMTFKQPPQDALYAPDAYRSSDHDPVIIGLALLNYPPELGDITAPVDPVPVGTTVNVSVPFTDPDALDTHTATWDWGDGTTSPGTAAEDMGAGTITGQHTYTTPGLYTIQVTVEDNWGNSDTASFVYVVVYDPKGGFVTGGGWFTSPPGAYTPDPTLTGKAIFGFVSKYEPGATVPTGETQFYFHAADFRFASTSYDWLVVAGNKAIYKGSGTVNGEGDYGFMLSAVDAQGKKGGSVDKLRVKIWNKATDQVIYDNQMGADDDAAPNTSIEGGSIIIHK